MRTGGVELSEERLIDSKLSSLWSTALSKSSSLVCEPLWREVADGLESGALRAVHGQSLRYITNSGGVLRPRDSREIRRSFPGVAIYAMYGLTEAFRSAFLPPEELEEHPDSFGYPIAGVELLLVSTSDGRVLDGAAIGELVHAGPFANRTREGAVSQTQTRTNPYTCAHACV